jgi:predicted regulator of Ras-like GTPase activity (Roadblock/LC7/MglB family)
MNFLKSHPARIYAVLVAALPILAHFLPDVPTEAVLAVAAAILGTGEAVQRVENTKTADAYWADAYGE